MRRKRPLGARSMAVLMVLLVTGCTAGFYHKQADKDVYKILKQVEEDIFGKSSEFTIETARSGRKPKDVTSQSILDARTPLAERVVLTIDEALEYAVRNSREFQSEKESLYLAALNLTGERHTFFPQFFASSRATGTRFEDGERRGTVASGVGVTQALLTGADIGVSIANDLLRYYTGDPRRAAASVISMNLFQPLLRGAGRKIAGERLKQAHRNVFYAIRDYSHFQHTFAVDVVVEYFRLLQTKDAILNAYNNYLGRRDDTRRLRARSVDRVSPQDVAESQQDELTARDGYLRAITNFRNALDRFKIALGMPLSIDLRVDDLELTRLREAGLAVLDLNSSACFRIALENRLPLLNEIDRFEDRKRQVAIAADQLKADLNIIGDASVANDEGPTDYAQFDFSKVRASVGVQLILPLDRLRERNQYRATLIDFEESIRNLGLTFDQLRNQIDEDLRELGRLKQSHDIEAEAVQIAEMRVRGSELRLELGDLEYRQLTESRNSLLRSRNSLTAATINYLEAKMRLLTDLGILSTQEETFWVDADALQIDLAKWRGKMARETLPGEGVAIPSVAPAFTDEAAVPTPEEVFAN